MKSKCVAVLSVSDMGNLSRGCFKIKLLVQHQDGAEFQPAGIHQYVEDLKRETNAEIGPKDNFETASIINPCYPRIPVFPEATAAAITILICSYFFYHSSLKNVIAF